VAAGDADDLLQRAGAMLDKNPTTTGQYTQTATVAALSAPLISGGSFYFDRDRGISWHVERPISARFVFRPAAVEQQATPAQQMPMQWVGRLLNATMAGDLAELSRTFYVDGSVAADRWALSLTPRSAAVARALVRIDIEGGVAVDRVELSEANGDTLAITFSHVDHPPNLPAEVQSELEQAH
jgi:hypothetical protein